MCCADEVRYQKNEEEDMAKNLKEAKGAAAPAAPAAGEGEPKLTAEAKAFDGIKGEDLGALKKGIDEIRAYANSAMSECIRLASAFNQFHYVSKDGKMRDKEQDKRVQEGARARGAEAVRNLRLYFRRIEEEIRGAQKTI